MQFEERLRPDEPEQQGFLMPPEPPPDALEQRWCMREPCQTPRCRERMKKVTSRSSAPEEGERRELRPDMWLLLRLLQARKRLAHDAEYPWLFATDRLKRSLRRFRSLRLHD
ncbi:hypothetical protein [Mumia zhuanghuii]|uniref:Uncharacterized protein n=1 Tax=Mumia zhuanghuii TaxID=2585211 RepID=A0A5C4M683_9ACTN|nr:hypothetical protein [Mumia zhuanghuii]TNC28441.1 hypothetical protein FHE65_34030 [Mumia zhuanghuii]